MLAVLIGAALVFNFISGYNDSSNIVATVISSRALRPRQALWMSAAAEMAAPFLFGVAVAETFGRGLLQPGAVKLEVVLAAVLAAIGWSLATSWLGIPSSSSHALVGGMLGAGLLAGGPEVIQWGGVAKVLLAILISPAAGLAVGWLLMQISFFLFAQATPRINVAFRRMQILTSLTLALAYGSNDAQKSIGIITLGLVTGGVLSEFTVPLWVIAASAAALGLGTACGGWRLIRTLGGRIYKIRPIHAFTSQLASAGVILGAALGGVPVSTTQVVSSAIMGAGAAERVSKVRWMVAQDMVITWLFTVPISSLLGAGMYQGMVSLGLG